jgi:RNA polymerase sigma factor (sigma-70 family)
MHAITIDATDNPGKTEAPASPGSLFRAFAPRVRGLARRHCNGLRRMIDADDVVQSVFARLFRRMGRTDLPVPEPEELWRLLAVMTRNRIRSLAARHRAGRRDHRRVDDAVDPGALPVGTVDRDLERLVLNETLAQLPADCREVTEFRLAGHSVAEIAERSGRSLRTVERLLNRARTLLEAARAAR